MHRFLEIKLKQDGLGWAVLFCSDVAGTGSLTSTKAYASIAYHQELGLSSLLTAGFNVGWANKRIDQSKLTFLTSLMENFLMEISQHL